MSSTGSVTYWLGQLQAGDPNAAQALWERYFRRVTALARKMLRNAPRRVADEEDLALSAFDSFCRGAEQGRFPQLADRDNLWRILVVITARKVFDQIRFQKRRKRSEGAGRPAEITDVNLEGLFARDPDPEFAAQVADECRHLLDRLRDADLRAVAMWKMEGYTNAEIAAKLDCTRRTVERKLRLIRTIWAEEGAR